MKDKTIRILKEMQDIGNGLDREGMLREANVVTSIMEKIAMEPGSEEGNLSYNDLAGTSMMRLFEMTVESSTTKPNNVPLVMQFFKDLQIYGMNEAIAYVRGYEKSGEYVPGTADKLEQIKQNAIANLKMPMQEQEQYVMDDNMLEDLSNRFYKIEQRLPEPSVEDGVMVDKNWVEQFAQAARVPVEIAYVWSDMEWSSRVLDEEVKAMAQQLKNSGKVVVNL